MAAPHYSAAAGAPAGGSGVQLAQLNDEKALLLADGKPIAKPFTKAQVRNLAVRKWLSVNAAGEATVLEVDKLRVTHQLGVQLRDLRLLDPQLAASYPSAILCRDRALVVNMEFIKCVVTTSAVYVTNLEDENTVQFVEELQKRLAAAHRASLGQGLLGGASSPSLLAGRASHPALTGFGGSSTAAGAGSSHALLSGELGVGFGGGGGMNGSSGGGSGVPPSSSSHALLAARPGIGAGNACGSGSGVNLDRASAPAGMAAAGGGHGALGFGLDALGGGGTAGAAGVAGAASGVGLDQLGAHAEDMPFELRAVEVALDTVTGYMERLTSDLEAAAHPALDALTARINTSNLERVRRIKNRMVRLTTRVETLREVLEKFLEDDSDMKDMNLTAKEQEQLEMLARHSLRGSARASAAATPFDVPLPLTGGLGELGAMTPMTPYSARSSRSSRSSASSSDLEDDEAVEAVEMLLEPYFMQLDQTWNKLQTLCEYVDDTEDFINIELDSHRNALIRIDLVLTSFTAACGLITAITGLFAMNVQLRPEPAENPGPYSMFVTLSTTSGALALLGFASVIAYCKWKRLI